MTRLKKLLERKPDPWWDPKLPVMQGCKCYHGDLEMFPCMVRFAGQLPASSLE